eukprot:56968-Amphidinium_carterae.2
MTDLNHVCSILRFMLARTVENDITQKLPDSNPQSKSRLTFKRSYSHDRHFQCLAQVRPRAATTLPHTRT